MTYARDAFGDDSDTLPRMPVWITSGRAKTLEDVAFLSGAALNHLHLVVGHEDIPQSLLRAAEACMAFSGRPEPAADLRDAMCLLRPEDQPGPAGEIGLLWQRAVERR